MNLYNYIDLIDNKPIHIATVNDENKPNIAVACNVKVIEEDKLVIFASEMNNTPKNIERNPNVVITAFDNDWKGIRIFGKAYFYPEGKYFDLCYDAFWANNPKNLSSGITPKGAIVVTVDKIEDYQ